MKKILILALLLFPTVASAAWYNPLSWFSKQPDLTILGVAYQTFSRSIVPIDSTENIGTTTAPWDEGHFNQLCLNGSCKVSWPTGGGGSGGGTFSTSTAWGSVLYNYPNNSDDIVAIGYDGSGVATSSDSEFYVDPTAKIAGFLNDTKVGIGTSSPATIVHVWNPTGEGTMILGTGLATSYSGFLLRDYLNQNAGSLQYGNPSAGVPDQLFFGSRQAQIPVYMYQGGVAAANRRLSFASTTDSTQSESGVYVSNVNFGIGTTSPYAALSVVGSSGVVADHYTATGTASSVFPSATISGGTINNTTIGVTTPVAGRFTSIGVGKSASASIRADLLLDGTYTQGLRIEGDTATRLGFSTYVTGDGQVRFTFRPDGQLAWGDGSSVTDTNLYRDGVSVLRTDDLFRAPNASTTLFSSLDAVYVGRTATTTIRGDGVASTLPYASTTALTVGTHMIAPFKTLVANFASSTAIVSTSTALLGPAASNLTVDGVRCETDTGTVGVSLYDGTNRANYIPTASTTMNYNAYTSNNTFTTGESIRVDIGTPASSPKQVTCRFVTRDTSF